MNTLWPLLTSLQLLMDDVENEISLTAFRLLVLDLMTLYAVMNEGTINVLGRSNWFTGRFRAVR